MISDDDTRLGNHELLDMDSGVISDDDTTLGNQELLDMSIAKVQHNSCF